jgi:hAT family C-terminal dimerisation region
MTPTTASHCSQGGILPNPDDDNDVMLSLSPAPVLEGAHNCRSPEMQELLHDGTCMQDYLAIMASSVSSEHVFSSAGLTLSKCCNHLKGDIVKALQCLKCMYHNDIIFQEVIVATEEEEELEDVDSELAVDISVIDEGFTWDQLLVDDENMYDNIN